MLENVNEKQQRADQLGLNETLVWLRMIRKSELITPVLWCGVCAVM